LRNEKRSKLLVYQKELSIGHQWQKLAAIVERGFAQVEAAADLHARAAETLEAVDNEVRGLRADYAPGKALSPRPRDRQPAAAPLAA